LATFRKKVRREALGEPAAPSRLGVALAKEEALAKEGIARLGYFVICKNSIGAPAASMKATRTPSDGLFGLIITFFPQIAASRSSTSNATCETVFTNSGNGQSSSNRIHCTAYAWRDDHLRAP